jgi:flagellar protein FlaF
MRATMNVPRTHTYGSALSPTKSPRDAEAAILARITARMAAAGAGGPTGFPQLAQALSDNRRFWTAAATDLAGPGNTLPEALRASLLSLAAFTISHTSQVLGGDAGVEALVEINRAVIRGLASDGAPA